MLSLSRTLTGGCGGFLASSHVRVKSLSDKLSQARDEIARSGCRCLNHLSWCVRAGQIEGCSTCPYLRRKSFFLKKKKLPEKNTGGTKRASCRSNPTSGPTYEKNSVSRNTAPLENPLRETGRQTRGRSVAVVGSPHRQERVAVEGMCQRARRAASAGGSPRNQTVRRELPAEAGCPCGRDGGRAEEAEDEHAHEAPRRPLCRW